ncbi:MAG: GNAT family N-acetyltransferase [Actinomycetota bacterium]
MTSSPQLIDPPDWNVDVVTSDGGAVHLRPIRPDDGPRLLALNERISDRTAYLRFFSYRRNISDKELERLVTVDYVDRLALVAMLADEIIAVGRYDRTGDDEAEVAFLVEDAHQHRGLGTLLLEHLAVLGRRNGIDRFNAITLAENRKMLGVFRAAGFRTTRTFEDGMYRVEFPIDHIDPEPLFRREQQADVASITRILRPHGVAVIGASRSGHGHGNRILHQLRAGPFSGSVAIVHPEADEIAGLPAVASIAEVPFDVDLAIVAVGAEQVPDIVTECGAAGVGSLCVITSGFAEDGVAGEEQIRQLASLAHRHGMRLVGPNSLGVLNTDVTVALLATFADVVPSPGPFGLLSQSGMLAVAALERAAEIGLGISSFVSVGDKADVSGNDLLQYWEQDPRTRVIGLYLESFGNPVKFSRLARRVGRSKPIITVKSGRSLRPDPLTEEAIDALFRQTGVVRVDTIEELLDTAKVLADCPLPLGPRVQVVGNVGGAALLCADACRAGGLELAQPSDETMTAVAAAGAVLGPPGQPIELPVASDGAAWSSVLSSVLDDDDVDAVIATHHAVLATDATEVADALVEAASLADGKPILASILEGAVDRRTLRTEDGQVQIPVFPFPEAPAKALARAHRYAQWRMHRFGVVPEPAEALVELADEAVDWATDAPRPATRAEADRILDAAGITLAERTPGARFALRLAIRLHPSFGPIVSARLEEPDTGVAGRPGYRLAPLSDEDATSLLRHLPGLDDLDQPVDAADHGPLVDLVLRVGTLAAEMTAIEHGTIGPVHVTPSGCLVQQASFTLRPGDAAQDLPIRRL